MPILIPNDVRGNIYSDCLFLIKLLFSPSCTNMTASANMARDKLIGLLLILRERLDGRKDRNTMASRFNIE